MTQVTITLKTPNGDRTEEQQLSPYSYQHYPKTPSALKGNILGTADTGVALTKGRGHHYLYFKHEGRVEWCAITPEAFKLIAGGAALTVTEVKPAEQPAAPAEQPATEPVASKPAKRERQAA